MIKIHCGSCRKISDAQVIETLVSYKCERCGAKNEVTNVGLKEWVGFNYNSFKENIIAGLQEENFEFLLAGNEFEESVGKLSKPQVEKLRNQLKIAFRKEESIRDIALRIQKNVGVNDLLSSINGKIIKDNDGVAKIKTMAERRAITIARSETIRAAAKGSLRHYSENGITQVKYVASIGVRTCIICETLNGRVMKITEASGVIPAHVNCRCSWRVIDKEAGIV